MKKGIEKGKINFSMMIFFHTIYFNPLYVYTKFEDSTEALIGADKSGTKKFI